MTVGELTSEHLTILLEKVSIDADNEFSIEKALRVYPTNAEVARHNEKVFQYFEKKRADIHTIKVQD